MQKPLSDLAMYIKNTLPVEIPETYALKPIIKEMGDEKNIRESVLAFRDFLNSLYDRLIIDGDLYYKPPKKEDSHASLSVGYPFLDYLKSILINIGYGDLQENNASIILYDLQSLFTIWGPGGSWKMRTKITTPKLIECLKFLSLCGIHFDGIDLHEKKINISNITSLVIKYPENPALLLGFKVMAIAHIQLHITKYNDDLFLRCDYKALVDDETDITYLLKEAFRSLSAKVQDFIMTLHNRYINAGLTCRYECKHLNFRFFYSHKNKEIWMLSASFHNASRLLIKANNTNKYADIIETFSEPLQEKIARGYGCEKKRFGEPCQWGCHGFSFPLDDSILNISGDIEVWLDKELSCLQRKKS